LTNVPIMENLLLELTHNELTCPYCELKYPHVTTWGSYKTDTGEVRRYYCYECKKSFNASKLPKIYERMGKIAFSLAMLVIQNNNSISNVAKTLNVPESTLRHVIDEIENQLTINFEFIKSLDQALKEQIKEEKDTYRIIYYDEGFHNLLGGQFYLLFAVNEAGIPVQAELTSSRNRDEIKATLEQAITKMGGVDMIVTDGSPTILAAVRGMYRSLVLVQQIHSDKGKRARIIKLDPVLRTKLMRELTIELHTESLKFDKESEITVNIKEVYPSQLKGKLAYQKPDKTKKKT
jgi:transposase-like protein